MSAPSSRVTQWNWEAALTPFWGWRRNVPVAFALSVAFPALAYLAMTAMGTPTKTSALVAYTAVAVGYTLVYGVAGHAMMVRAKPVSAVFRILAGLLIVASNYMVIGLAATSAPMERANLSAVKGRLRELAAAQDSFYAESLRYAGSLEEVGFASADWLSLSITSADSSEWSAAGQHSGSGVRCTIRGVAKADTPSPDPVCVTR